jgi:uncharacterized linocin/CFP29 family protein
MADNLGRDKLWNPETWTEIDKAVQTEVGRIRVAQKVFPTVQMPNAANVSEDVFDPQTMSIAEGLTQPFVEISIEFPLRQSQVDNEATLRNARTLARMAATTVALAEDLLFFQGANVPLPRGVLLTNQAAARTGLLNIVNPPNAPIPVVRPGRAQARQGGKGAQGGQAVGQVGGYGAATFNALVSGIATLIAAGQPGPYALFLETSIYADTHQALDVQQGTLVTTADRIAPLVTGGLYGTGTLPANTGLLVSLGGEPTTIYVAQDAMTAYTQSDQQGIYRFRVFERVQMIARDPRVFVRLQFQ